MLTAPFSLDATITAQQADLTDLTSGDTLDVIANVYGFDPADTQVSWVFTAKVSLTDADNAPTTVQKTIGPDPTGIAPSGVRDVPLSPSIKQGHFLLSQTDTAKLVSCTVYSLRVFVTRAGNSYDRTVLRGNLSAAPGSTGLSVLFSGALALTTGGPALAAVGTNFTPAGLVDALNTRGAAAGSATNWTVYQKGINQTVSVGKCSRWGDVINNAHPWTPSAGFPTGASVAGDGAIIGEGLEVPDCSLGKTITDDNTDITTGTPQPGTDAIFTLGSRHDVGMTWGMLAKMWAYCAQLTVGESTDVNFLQASYIDSNSQASIWSGAGAGLDGMIDSSSAGGTPIMNVSVWGARTTGGALANQPLVRKMYGRDIALDAFYDTNTNDATHSLTAANRRWRSMFNNGGLAPGVQTACHLAYNCVGRPDAVQNKLLCDYNEALNTVASCWVDPRPHVFYMYGDSWQPQAGKIQNGENGSPLMPNTAVCVFARSGNDLRRWQFPMAHYLADLDLSKRSGRLAVMFGEYLNGGTPRDNGYCVEFIRAIDPKVHVVVYNITHTGTNSAANDPTYQNFIDANWQSVWGADALIDFRNMPLWYSTYHYGDGSNTFPPGEKAIIYDGVSQHPSALGQEYMTPFYRAGAYASTGQDDSAVPMHIDPTDGVGNLTPSLSLSAGTPTGSVTWLVKNRAGATLLGRTLTFSSLDPSIATVNAATGVVTRVAAGRARIKVVTDLGGVGVLGVEVS